MDIISYTAVRAKLAEAMDKVNDDHRPVIITRQRGKPAVLLSLDDFNSYVETDYLLSNPKNAARLAKGVRDRINSLIDDIPRRPFAGLGKPELLKRNLRGFWSRRINREHRLVYRVETGVLQIAQCRFHY